MHYQQKKMKHCERAGAFADENSQAAWKMYQPEIWFSLRIINTIDRQHRAGETKSNSQSSHKVGRVAATQCLHMWWGCSRQTVIVKTYACTRRHASSPSGCIGNGIPAFWDICITPSALRTLLCQSGFAGCCANRIMLKHHQNIYFWQFINIMWFSMKTSFLFLFRQ